MVYHHAGCPYCTLLPYAIWSLQGYPGELVRSSGMDITLDNILTMLDEHYNNVKALDVQNQELFQLCMGEKEMVLDWGVCLSRHLQILAASFLEHFPPDHVAKLKWDHFYGVSQNDSKWWWPTWKQALMKKCSLTISELQGRLKRKRLWNHPIARLLISQIYLRPWISFLCKN